MNISPRQPTIPASTGSNPSGGADPGGIIALADQCVQCGLCLPACPTYGLDQLEAESPRGRIALARAWALGTTAPSPAGDTHLDQCLGCRRCEAVCPAHVRYGDLLVQARAEQRRRRPVGRRQEWTEWLVARPRLLAWLLGVYRTVFTWLPVRWRVLPRPPAPGRFLPLPLAGTDPVGLFIGCVAGPYEAGLRDAVARTCHALGVPLVLPASQACCGALHAHAGDLDTSMRLAGRNRSAFAQVATVLTLSSGCHDSIAHALPGTTRTIDAIDFIAQRADRLRLRPANERVALHLPCTQRNTVHSVEATRALLARLPGIEVIELAAGHGCCGAAGSRMLADPQRAAAFRQPLLDQFLASGATRLLSANIGCRLHFANALQAPVQHPLDYFAGWIEA